MKEIILSNFNGNWLSFYEKYLNSTITSLAGDEYQARCPFNGHEDKNPSFNFNGQTGLYKCHGCGKKGDPFHLYAKIAGLRTGADFGKVLKGIARDFGIDWTEIKAKFIEAYDYQDPDGNLLFQVCRFEPGKAGKKRDFCQRRPDGKNGWIWKLGDTKPVLYNLPAVAKATRVLVVEGERDVATVNSLGLVGTCNPGGAGKWKPQYTDTLKDKHVVLIGDNDKAGKEHMVLVGTALNGHVESLKLLELPDLPAQGDISDWVAKVGDKGKAVNDLCQLIEDCKPYNPPKKMTLGDMIMSMAEVLSTEVPSSRTLLFPWLKEDSINLLFGWRGCGKTWTALSIAKAVSTGTPFGPWRAETPTPCLFLDGEMPFADTRERLVALNITEDMTNFHMYSDAYANQHGIARAHLAHETWRQDMKRILRVKGIKLLILDNLASLASGIDENKKADWDPINQWLLELRFIGIATLMLHHTGKELQQRGTSAREDNLDVSVTLKKPPNHVAEDGCKFIMHFNKHRIRTADLSLIADTEFQLIETAGNHTWTFGNVKGERKREILRMIDEGYDYNAIKDDLGISKGYITKVKNKAISDKLLSKDSKLTLNGYEFLKAK